MSLPRIKAKGDTCLIIGMGLLALMSTALFLIKAPDKKRPPMPWPVLPFTEDVDIKRWTAERERAMAEQNKPLWTRIKEDFFGKQSVPSTSEEGNK